MVAASPERFRVVALAGGQNIAKLMDQVERFEPELVSVADEAGAEALRQQLPDPIPIEVGAKGL